MKRYWLRFVASVCGGRAVYLRDFDGEVVFSIARRSPFGGLFAYRYTFLKVGLVRLLDSGKTEGSSYVVEWKWV